MTNKKSYGFATIEIVVVVVVLVLITGFAIWRIQASKHAHDTKNLISGPLTAEDRQRLEATPGEEASTAESTPSASENTTSLPPPSSGSGSGSGSSQNQNTSTSGQNNGSSNQSTSTSPSPQPPSAPNPPPATNNRPTAEFCKQKDGASFTNAWVTDNSSHTYQIWENGAWVSKTETGTAALNYDSMQVVGVIPYHKQAKWAICSDKAGYVMFYYQPAGSIYTYNWLVPFEHITLVQP